MSVDVAVIWEVTREGANVVKADDEMELSRGIGLPIDDRVMMIVRAFTPDLKAIVGVALQGLLFVRSASSVAVCVRKEGVCLLPSF